MVDRLAPSTRHKFIYNGQAVYEWDQTKEEVNMYVVPPPGVPSKSIDCHISHRHLRLGIKGNPPFIDEDFAFPVKSDESFWTLENGSLHITLQKAERNRAWPGALRGHAQLDATTAEGETKRIMLERFQEENPGFDFSNATFNGACPDPATFMQDLKHG
eukprot:jgi/Mesvir1/4259/Mv22223-RA.1